MGAMIESLARIGWTLAEALEAEDDLEQVSRALNREAAIRSVMKILEQADSLEWASTALIQEAAIRCVMKVRACTREEATKLIKGGKL